MSEAQTQLFNKDHLASAPDELTVDVLPAFHGALGRQVDVIVAPPVSADEWDALTQSHSVFSKVSHVFEGENLTRFRLLGEAVEAREEFSTQIKQGLLAIRGIGAGRTGDR